VPAVANEDVADATVVPGRHEAADKPHAGREPAGSGRFRRLFAAREVAGSLHAFADRINALLRDVTSSVRAPPEAARNALRACGKGQWSDADTSEVRPAPANGLAGTTRAPPIE
jgi:hypothetical protein